MDNINTSSIDLWGSALIAGRFKELPLTAHYQKPPKGWGAITRKP